MMDNSLHPSMRVGPGFANPGLDAQATFRAILQAMAQPGRCVPLAALPAAPMPLSPAAAAISLTLFDLDTPVWLDADAPQIWGWLAFHCGCPRADEPGAALFGVVTEPSRMPPLDAFPLGTPAYPDRSATLVIQVERLREGLGHRLSGPGIGDVRLLDTGLPDRFWGEVRRNQARFPQGVDVLLVGADCVVGLPRTTKIED